MSSKQPQHESGQNSSRSLKRRLGRTNQRYQLFFQKAGEMLNRAMASATANSEVLTVVGSIHISDFISVLEVERLLQSSELRDTESWVTYIGTLSDTKTSELGFNDWPEANVVLDTLPNPHDAVAQVMALNESFAGFVNLLVSWIQFQDEYRRLIALCKEHGRDETELLLELAAILPEEVPHVPKEDLLSASVFILEMVESD